MTTKNILTAIFGIALLLLAIAPLISANNVNTRLYFEDTSATSKTIIRGDTFEVIMVASSYEERLALEKLELINESSTILIKSWDEPGTEIDDGTYYFEKIYTIDSNAFSAGTYKLRFTAKAGTGHENYKQLELIVKVLDTNAPSVSISSPVNGSTYTTQITTAYFTVDAPEKDLDSCYYSLNGGPNITIPGCSEVGKNEIIGLNTIEGQNTLTIYAKDTFRNIGSAKVTFSVDTSAPTITILNPQDGDELEDVKVILRVSTDETATVEYSLNGEPNITMTEVLNLTFESEELELKDDRTYTVTFYATDLVGNMASITIEFNLDEIREKDDNDNGDSYYHTEFIEQHTPKELVLDLTDNEPNIELNWWQKFINWLSRLFRLEEIY